MSTCYLKHTLTRNNTWLGQCLSQEKTLKECEPLNEFWKHLVLSLIEMKDEEDSKVLLKKKRKKEKECKFSQQPLRRVWKLLKKLKIELPYDSVILLLCIYPEEILIWKNTCTPMFIAVPFTIAKTLKQSKCLSTEEEMKTM